MSESVTVEQVAALLEKQEQRWKEWNDTQQDYSAVSWSIGDVLENLDVIAAAYLELSKENESLRQAAELAVTELTWLVHGQGKNGGKYETALDALQRALGEVNGQA